MRYLPYAWIAAETLKDAAFFSDLETILSMETADVVTMFEVLTQLPGFLSKESAAAALTEFGPRSEALLNLVNTLGGMRRDFELTPEQVAEHLATAAHEQTVLDGKHDLLRERAALLASPVPGIERQVKAQGLAKTSASIASMTLICDLRAVFDSTRTRLEGLFPIATLRLQRLEGQAVEVSLTAGQVQELARLAEQGQGKLELMTRAVKLLQNDNVYLPEDL